MDLIVRNPQEIRQLATDIVRMANAEHPMLKETYERFVDAGIENPSYAQMTLKKAEYDSYIRAAGDLQAEEIGVHDYMDRIKRTRNSLSNLERTDKGRSLFGAIRKMYPKTAIKRVSILGGLSEGHNALQPCRANKVVKKFTYRVLRLLNR